MTVNASAIYVDPLEGTGMTIFATSIVCGAVSFVVVTLRTYVRVSEQAYGWDDGLMLGGLLVYFVEIAVTCEGLGALDERLNAFMEIQARKYLMLWMLLYIFSLVLIKSSICVTMLRIGSTVKAIRIAIYTLLIWAICTFIATFIGILCICSPVEANWNTALVLEGKATCSSMATMIGLSYFPTASSIATDMACAVLPAILLWRTQMKLSTKISVSVLLSFGSFASISTMIRTPYIRYYWNPTDNLPFHVGNIVLWSNIETAIGLVAGSLPTLRRLIVRRSFKSESNANPVYDMENGPSSNGLRSRQRNREFKNPTDLGVSIATVHTRRDGDWRRLQEDTFDKEESASGIRADYTYEVEMSRDPEHQSVGSSQELKR